MRGVQVPQAVLAMKLIRFDEDHFGYLVNQNIARDKTNEICDMFSRKWPGKSLLVIAADEFIDLTGQYDIVRRDTLEPEAVPA